MRQRQRLEWSTVGFVEKQSKLRESYLSVLISFDKLWTLKYRLFNWRLCPKVFWLPWKLKQFFNNLENHIYSNCPTVCPVRISLIWWLLGSVTMCDSPVILTKIAKNHLNYQRLALNLCAKELRTHFFLFLNLNPNGQDSG